MSGRVRLRWRRPPEHRWGGFVRALVYLGPGSAELQDRPAARLVNGDDVVVEVTGTGVCGTDRKILLGRFPARPGVVLGHESVGVVRDTTPSPTAATYSPPPRPPPST
ncbi:alcohol dehydrogenase catalytic domain-containing protein [Streptomyces lavendulae]|uniref:alcohol dehydrogenase catalytic domain-containing protein n=1 Tax=Streptomyces lavendulae TaxID=1914 RepID=UPI0033F2AF34